MQSFLTTVARLIREKELPALMIGGHAVTALGHPRATFDLDLLIPRSAVEAWKNELESLSYHTYAETSNFLQFEPRPGFPLPPVDLMIVDNEVFEALFATKSESAPSVTSVIALKLHAINQPSRENTGQDWADVLSLVRANKLSLDNRDFSSTVLKHGGSDAIERIQAAISGGS